jgi:hypothetical protein
MKKIVKGVVGMKKLTLMVALALLVILSCASLTACTCSSGEQNGTTPAQTAKPTSVGSESWGDIPIYSGAKEVFKIKSDQNETLNDKPAVYEHRVYETSAKRDDVVAFYKDKMPANGWIEESWMEMGSRDQGGSIGQYDKNDGQAIAVVTCTDTDKGTMLTLDKKSIK